MGGSAPAPKGPGGQPAAPAMTPGISVAPGPNQSFMPSHPAPTAPMGAHGELLPYGNDGDPITGGGTTATPPQAGSVPTASMGMMYMDVGGGAATVDFAFFLVMMFVGMALATLMKRHFFTGRRGLASVGQEEVKELLSNTSALQPTHSTYGAVPAAEESV